MYKDTITMFSRKSGGRGQPDTWYPTVIEGVNLNIDRAAILAKYGTDAQDNAALSIRYTRQGDEIFVAGKPWMPPKEWSKDEGSLTFTSGAGFDFFWRGVWDGGTVSDDAGFLGDEDFYTYMNRKYDYVFAITSVARYSVIPHFEIMGK